MYNDIYSSKFEHCCIHNLLEISFMYHITLHSMYLNPILLFESFFGFLDCFFGSLFGDDGFGSDYEIYAFFGEMFTDCETDSSVAACYYCYCSF